MVIIYKTGNFEGLSIDIKVRDAVTVRLQACLQPGPRNSSFEKVNIFPSSSFFLEYDT
jgi:hypothetical protein